MKTLFFIVSLLVAFPAFSKVIKIVDHSTYPEVAAGNLTDDILNASKFVIRYPSGKVIRVFDPRTGRPLFNKRYGKTMDRLIPKGSTMEIPDEMLVTRDYPAIHKSVEQLCREQISGRNCQQKLSKINHIHNPSAQLFGFIQVPKSFQINEQKRTALRSTVPVNPVEQPTLTLSTIRIPSWINQFLIGIVILLFLAAAFIAARKYGFGKLDPRSLKTDIHHRALVSVRDRLGKISSYRFRRPEWTNIHFPKLPSKEKFRELSGQLFPSTIRKKQWLTQYANRALLTLGKKYRVQAIELSRFYPALIFRFHNGYADPQLVYDIFRQCGNLEPEIWPSGNIITVRFPNLNHWVKPEEEGVDREKALSFGESFFDQFSDGLGNSSNNHEPLKKRIEVRKDHVQVLIAPNKDYGCVYPDPAINLEDVISRAYTAFSKVQNPDFAFDPDAVTKHHDYTVFTFPRKVGLHA